MGSGKVNHSVGVQAVTAFPGTGDPGGHVGIRVVELKPEQDIALQLLDFFSDVGKGEDGFAVLLMSIWFVW